MLDPNIFNTPQIEQLYTYERLEDLVALLYDVNLKSKRGFSFNTSEAQLKLEHDSLLADLSANPSFQETLSKAIEAVKVAQITIDTRWLNEDEIDITKANKDTQVKTITFVFWAEQASITIPKSLISRLDHVFLDYSNEQAAIEKEAAAFPRLTPDELETKKLEPLWFIHGALLYWLHKNNKSQDIKYIANFLEQFAHVKKLITQLDDAILTGEVKVFADPAITTDNELQNKLLKKIKPLEFIAFVEKITEFKFTNDQILIKEARKLKEPHTNGYTTEYITLMLAAIEYFSITTNNQPTKDSLKHWFKLQNDDLSDRITGYMATLVRLPEMQKGGNWRANKLERDIAKSPKKPKKNKG